MNSNMMVHERKYESERNCDSDQEISRTELRQRTELRVERNCDSGQESFAVVATLIYGNGMQKFSHVIITCRIITHSFE